MINRNLQAWGLLPTSGEHPGESKVTRFGSSLWKRIALANLIFIFLLTATASRLAQASKDRKSFAALSARLSEPGGYFDSDNLISNETSYLHVLGKLNEFGVKGGVYLGVGPDQNFSYIARVRPRIAILIDIRRDNLLQHLMFKALFGRSRNRIDYLCMLFGKKPPVAKGWEKGAITELAGYIDKTPSSHKVFDKTLKMVRADVQRFGIAVSDSDLETIARIQKAFYASGLDIRYSSHHRPPRSIYPTYRELLFERDLAGRMSNWLNSEDDFQFLKKLQDQDLIIPVVGDLSGPRSVKAIAEYLAEINERVSAFYVSNVEFYLQRQGTYDRFVENLKALPVDGRSMMIRSYFNYYAPSHPQAERNYFSTQLLQRIEDLIKLCEDGGCQSYYEITTRYVVPLK